MRLLQIDTSPRYNHSHSRTLAQEFVDKWSSHHPETEIFHRDLGLNPVPYLDETWMKAKFTVSDQYHLIAPDLPGFGFTDIPSREQFEYTFEHLAQVIDRFTQVMEMSRYAIYVFNYGAPIGFRLAIAHPEQITALISQNGNAYEDGLSEGWNPIQRY